MIKPINDEQIDAVMRIWLETNMSAHRFIPRDYWVDHYDEVREFLPKATVYVYEDDEALKGFVGITDNQYIAGIFVGDKWQSQGIGLQMLEWCKERYKSLELDVYVSNGRAISFYARNGFTIVSEKIDEDTKEREYRMRWERK